MEKLQTAINAQYEFMRAQSRVLYYLDIDDKEDIWNTYLDNIPEEYNPIYRERRVNDCQSCRHFLTRMGNIAIITEDLKIVTLWDFDFDDPEYGKSVKALRELMHGRKIKSEFLISDTHPNILGTPYNIETINGNEVIYKHLHLDVAEYRIRDWRGELSDRAGQITSYTNSLNNIRMQDIDTVLDLIEEKLLYRGEEYRRFVEQFKELLTGYLELQTENEKELYIYKTHGDGGYNRFVTTYTIKSTVIGQLLLNLANGDPVEIAVGKYEAMTAPANYKRPKAIFTTKMLEEAKVKINELGYANSLKRKYATLDEVDVSNVLYIDRDTDKKELDVFEEMSNTIAVSPRGFKHVPEVSIDEFISDIIPTSKKLEVLFENRHIRNMFSLTSAIDMESPSMFKWNNNFAWTYKGNITDTDIKANVEKAGGNTDGILRFSLQWNDEPGQYNNNDYDLHGIVGIILPDKTLQAYDHISYSAKRGNGKTGGELDIDIINPFENEAAVENIIWTDQYKMPYGVYQFAVNVYSRRCEISNFKCEIAFGDEVHNFEYNEVLKSRETVHVANIHYTEEGFRVEGILDGNSKNYTKEVWNVNTSTFVPISAIMYSPNYWNSTDGNKHVFFALKDCKSDQRPNGFYNEYLKNDLITHKRFFEALGNKMKIEVSDEQVSGIGFSSSLRNSMYVRVNEDKVINIKF